MMRVVFATIGLVIGLASAQSQPYAAQAPELVVQRGHFSGANALALKYDDSLLLTAGNDRTVMLWDVATGRQIDSLVGHSRSVTAVAFSPDGTLAASGARDGLVIIWNILSGREKIRFPCGNSVSSVAFSPDGKSIAIGTTMDERAQELSTTDLELGCGYSQDRPSLSQWNIETGTMERRYAFQHAVGPSLVDSISFSPDGELLAAVGPALLYVFSTRTGSERHEENFRGTSAGRRIVRFVSNDKLLMASEDIDTFLFDSTTGTLLKQYPGRVTAMALSKDRRFFVTGDVGGVVRRWDIESSRPASEAKVQDDRIPDIAISSDSNWIFTMSGDYQNGEFAVVKRNLETGHTSRFGSSTITPFALATSDDGSLAILGGPAGWSLWGLNTGQPALQFSDDVACVSVLKDGGLIMGTADGVWLMKAQRKRVLDGAVCSPVALAVAHDEQSIAVGCTNGGVFFVDVGGDTVDGTWHHRGRVASVAISTDGKRIVSTGAQDDQKLVLWDRTTKKEMDLTEAIPGGFSPFQRGHALSHLSPVVILPDNKYVVAQANDKAIVYWSLESGKLDHAMRDEPYWITTAAVTPNGLYLVVGTQVGIVEVRDATSGALVLRMGKDIGTAGQIRALTPLGSSNTVLAGSYDGTVTVWDIDRALRKSALQLELEPVARFLSFADGVWVVADGTGRFDTNNLEEVRSLHWAMAEEHLRTYPLEIFMRDYYEPRLLGRLLAGEMLKQMRSLGSLNRVQPLVEVQKTEWQDAAGGIARVTVKVSGNKDKFPRDGKAVEVSTGVYDLRLFRDGQLVGWAPKSSMEWQLEPPPTGARADELDLQRWREKTRVTLDADGTKHLSFVVNVPRRSDLKQVSFTAYAFNEDRVKSATASGTLAVTSGLRPRMGKAYIVSVGVNRTESSPNWDLQFAANDARKLSEVVSQRLGATHQFSAVVPLLLVSDQPRLGKANEAAATKTHLQSVLDVLAGRRKVDEQLKKEIPGAEGLERAQPEDLVLLAFSSHGYTDPRGVFHMVLADIGKDQPQDRITEELQKRTLSSDELSGWLREVDAGELVMIVDTCHSEATVAYDGFKPGPMGSRGLGQLAYDKGMRILAASKSAQSAIELGGDIKEGLLSYALVHEGLEEGKAAKDGKITMSGWLAYGAQEVPNLFTSGRAKGPNGEEPRVQSTRDIIYLGPDQAPPGYQQPVLFDFAKQQSDVLLGSK